MTSIWNVAAETPLRVFNSPHFEVPVCVVGRRARFCNRLGGRSCRPRETWSRCAASQLLVSSSHLSRMQTRGNQCRRRCCRLDSCQGPRLPVATGSRLRRQVGRTARRPWEVPTPPRWRRRMLSRRFGPSVNRSNAQDGSTLLRPTIRCPRMS